MKKDKRIQSPQYTLESLDTTSTQQRPDKKIMYMQFWSFFTSTMGYAT